MKQKEDMEGKKMFIVQEYYLLKDNIESHISSTNEELKNAYKDMINVYKICPEHYLVIPSIPQKSKEEFIKQILYKFKDKSILTITKC